MFTGIIQAVARLKNVIDHDGIRTFEIVFPDAFCKDLTIGASVAIDGVCLTVTERVGENIALFDVIHQSLEITTLGFQQLNGGVNVERAAKEGAEIGGHPLSGHIDFRTKIIDIDKTQGNCKVRFELPDKWKRYLFPKGYIAINGASLTLSEVDKQKNTFDVWLIPETRRMTTFEDKQVGDFVNIEIERGTQVIVDTIKDTLEENLGKLYPLLEQLLEQNNIHMGKLAATHPTLLHKK